jgi:hypothetical protein
MATVMLDYQTMQFFVVGPIIDGKRKTLRSVATNLVLDHCPSIRIRLDLFYSCLERLQKSFTKAWTAGFIKSGSLAQLGLGCGMVD